MKKLLPLLLCLAASATTLAVAEPAASDKAAAQQEYARFIAQAISLENLADLVATMDRAIDEGEHGLIDKQPDPGLVEVTSKSGLRIEFSATDAREAVIYYLRLSRGGAELRYDDATKFAALFTDRAGLPHLLDIAEGDKYTFAVRWLIKPSDWKKMLKQMQKLRAANRAEKDPARALVTAIHREIAARAEAAKRR